MDIETTGFRGQGYITVIGLYDGKTSEVFVKGKNLGDFRKEIRKYALLVTYNGKQFDLPFIRDTFGELPRHLGHIDLRYPLKRLGYTGGLKIVEGRLGLNRDEALGCLDGLCAVWLWQEYERENKKALDTLIRYNLEDVVALPSLAAITYNGLIKGLPIAASKLYVSGRPVIDIPYDQRLVRKLAERRARFA